MSAVDPADDDLSLAALLSDAGKQELVPSEAVMDVLLEALKSGRSIESVVSDRDVLSRRQRAALQQFVRQHEIQSLTRRSTVANRRHDTNADPMEASRRGKAATRTADQFETDCHKLLPTGFDRYDAEQEIGRGGWGVVLRAHDRQLDRTVAVKKMIDDGRGDQAAVCRFLNEASITAQLQHPGIVPVYERGLSLHDRQPFYAMKLLHGSTLRDRIRDYHQQPAGPVRRASFAQLLRSFVDVCDAVGFAHSRHIVHRDLKPSNVIVGEFGETVVVDWGLATRRDAEAHSAASASADQTLAAGTPSQPIAGGATEPEDGRLDGLLQAPVTCDGTVIGTPSFMSPEQASGKSDVDQRSDVYALGSMLYVLLTGKPPFHADTVEKTLLKVSAGSFEHPRSIDRRIPAPLASICCKAMASNRDDRYTDAAQLGADVNRYLTNERVSAHADSRLEQLARWCRRRPVLAVTSLLGTTVTTILTTIAALLIANARHAETEARHAAVAAWHAEQEARTAAESSRQLALLRLKEARTAADEWLIGLSGTLEHYPGLESVRQDLIRKAVAHYEALLSTADSNEAASLELIRDRLRLADLLLLQNREEAAGKLFEDVRRQTTDTAKQDLPADELAAERLNAITGLTMVELRSGQFSESSQETLTETLQRTPLAGFPECLELQNSAARAYLVMARGHIVNRDTQRAVAAFKSALRFAERCRSLQSNERSQRLLKTIRTELAATYSARNRYDAAADLLQHQIDDVNEVLQKHTDRPDLLETRALTFMRWANEQRQLGQVWAAEEAYRKAVEDLSAAWQLFYGDRFYNENLAIAQANLGQLSLQLHRPADAEPVLRQAVDQLSGVLECGQGDVATARRLAACNVSLGEVLVLKGDAAAEAQIQRSLDIFDYLIRNQQMSDPDRRARGSAMRNLGRWYLINQQPQRAADQLQATRRYVEGLDDNVTGRSRLLAATDLDLAATWQELQQPAASRDAYTRALERLRPLADAETSATAVRNGSATLCWIRASLEAPDRSTHTHDAIQRLHQMTSDAGETADTLQLSAIAALVSQQSDTGLQAIRAAIRRRRFPDAADQAIKGCLLQQHGQSAEAARCLAIVQHAVSEQPGRTDLLRWTAALEESLPTDAAAGKSVPGPANSAEL